MADELLSLAEIAVQAARTAGASDAFATASRGREVEISVRDGQVETVKDAGSKGVSIRLWVDGRYGSHSTNDLRGDAIDAFVAEAVALTRAVQPDAHRVVPDPARFEGRSDVDLQLVDGAVQALTREERLALCMAQNDELRGRDKVISATSGVSSGTSESAMVSSNGFSGTRASTQVWIGSEVTLQGQGDRKPEGWMWGGAVHRAELPDPKAVAALALDRVTRRLGATKGPSTRTKMVVDPSAASRILGQLLRPASGRALSSGRSFWAEHLGKKAVSDTLTLIDDPLLPRGFGSRHYDSDGIAARAMPIIDAGVLANVYVDTYYGNKLGMTPTATGSSNLVVQPGERDLAGILADIDDAIYVTSWLGGNSDTTSGDFSLGLRGHVVKNGEVGPPIDEMNMTGNLLSLFSRLIEVGSDPWPYSSRRVPTLVFDAVDFS
jgi:PmbA protein